MSDIDVRAIRKKLGLTQLDFAKKIGVSRDTVINYEKGETIPASKIEMLNNLLSDKENNNHSKPEKIYNEGVPIYDVDFSAGFVQMFKEGIPTVLGYLNIPEVKGSDYIVRVKGDSMLGIMNDGDWVGIKRISDLEVINFGTPYAIVTQDLQLLKYLFKSSLPGNLLLKSENTKHPEFDLPIKKILELYIITAVLPFSKIKTFM